MYTYIWWYIDAVFIHSLGHCEPYSALNIYLGGRGPATNLATSDH